MPSESSNIKVITRIRPLTREEEEQNVQEIVYTDGDKTVLTNADKDTVFSFYSSFPATTSHNVIFQSKVEPLVKRALEGYNVSILTFGATGSGKSHTLSGTDDEPGIIPLVNERIFKHAAEKSDKDFFVSVSFVDITDEAMTDLLNPHGRDMRIRQHHHKSIYVEGLSEMVVHTVDEITRLYGQGLRTRSGGASDIAAHRHRGTSVYTIRIEQREKKTSRFAVSATITLTDLAGIEGATDSKIASLGTKSLLEVLSALGGTKKSGTHVPYRNSYITRLLQESLGGNAFTLFLATLSPSEKDYKQTALTLEYCQYAQNIKNTIRLNIDETNDMIAELRCEIAKLRLKITNSPIIDKDDVAKMEVLIHDLDIAKKQTWSEREKLSQQIEQERRVNLTNNGMYEWVMESLYKGTNAVREKLILLQKEKDQLTVQSKDTRESVNKLKDQLQKMIADYSKFAESGKLSESETKKKVSAIHDTKEQLRHDSEVLLTLKQRLKEVDTRILAETENGRVQISNLKGNSELRQQIENEERQQLEMKNKAIISEELDRMKVDIETKKAEIQIRAAEGRQYSPQEGAQLESNLAQLKAEMSLVTLQLQILKQENDKLKDDLNSLYKVNRDEIEIQKLQHIQTFREYREVFEEQKHAIEARYQNLLQDSIQDAIILSTRSNELVYENQSLQQQIAEYKDKICKLESGQNQSV